MTSQNHETRLRDLLRDDTGFMSILRAVRARGLSDWAVGAGAVRNIVWDHLQGHTTPTPPRDIDVAYFNALDLDPARDREIEQDLLRVMPGVPWEVINQAAVHTWFEEIFGHPVEPLTSTTDAIGTWPETATTLGVRLTDDDHIEIIAPLGLDDLFDMIIRRNPRRVSLATYHHRIETKNHKARWPSVQIIR